jgi:hypothetical protein
VVSCQSLQVSRVSRLRKVILHFRRPASTGRATALNDRIFMPDKHPVQRTEAYRMSPHTSHSDGPSTSSSSFEPVEAAARPARTPWGGPVPAAGGRRHAALRDGVLPDSDHRLDPFPWGNLCQKHSLWKVKPCRVFATLGISMTEIIFTI